MTTLGKAAPVALLGFWCGLVAIGLGLALRGATEPPVWDGLSYVLKAYTFWHAIAAGKLFDPFALPMTVRPPGTILMSYPFGWSPDFRWFYFRSCFIPIMLHVTAVYIAGWSRHLPRAGHWLLAGLALALAGMPIFFQFQQNNALRTAVTWGLVDGFLAGICAVAAAATVRGVAQRSIGWSVFAALAGGLSLWIKPSGLALMGLVGLSWLILVGASLGWRFANLWYDSALRRFVIVSFSIAVLIFAVFTGLAFRSPYFSADNVAFGHRVLAVLKTEFDSKISLSFLENLLRMSFGYAVAILAVFGFVAALRRRRAMGHAMAALLCILVGLWFLFAETDASQVRYFLPFGVMAFIFLLPSLLAWLQNLRASISYAAAGAAIAPALMITALLLIRDPSDQWQNAMGINLHANDFRAENEQAMNLLKQLHAEGKSSTSIYFTDTTPPLRNLVAVFDHSNVIGQPLPKVTSLIPLDWQRATTIRVDEFLDADFVAAEFVADEAERKAILAAKQLPDFAALARLFNAWISGLTADDGISVISDTHARIARIVDRSLFEVALARLEADHNMPQAYRDANPQRWWSADELAARQSAPITKIAFHRITNPAEALLLHALQVTSTNGGVQAAFWFEPAGSDALGNGWYVFGHLIDAKSNIVGNAQSHLVTQLGLPPETIRRYSLDYANRPAEAVALAFGLFKPGAQDTDFLISDEGKRDWEGRRVIVPLPASQ